jgi:hypothetical protein
MSVFGTLLIAGSALTACPSMISDTQSVTKVSGWDVAVKDTKRKLEYMTVYSGHPSLRRSLKPKPQGRAYVWLPSGEEIWVECFYRHSAATLTRSVGSVKSCQLTNPAPLTSDPSTAVCVSSDSKR